MGLKTTFPDLPSHSTTLLCKVSKSYEIDLSSYLAQHCGDSCLINYASYLIGVDFNTVVHRLFQLYLSEH